MSGEPDSLRQRFDDLLEAARAAGREVELRRWIDAAAAPRAPEPRGDDPGRFGMIGESHAMQQVFERIERVADADVPLLIRGETGTGKELVARAVHERSGRAQAPFVAVNCAAIPGSLLESELFGHVRGAFTDAVEDRQGHFAAANGGTLFLDEIGDMPLEMQAKLLRVLQEGELRPVGGTKTVRVDVRVLAATHRDLAAMCASGAFREDLYFRLAVVEVALPPLRERDGDAALIATRLVPRLAADVGRPTPSLSPAALEALGAWSWPGNVRELENELRRAIALGGESLEPSDFSDAIAGQAG
ncbi:MAG: sigma 54-interacting transcriptional regulator [Planctomycetota bacterium]